MKQMRIIMGMPVILEVVDPRVTAENFRRSIRLFRIRGP